jgi:hypothetical protein
LLLLLLGEGYRVFDDEPRSTRARTTTRSSATTTATQKSGASGVSFSTLNPAVWNLFLAVIILEIRLIFEAEFYEFYEQIGPQIRRVLSLRIRDPWPLIRHVEGFAGLIHEL